MKILKTYKFRIKDKNKIKLLDSMDRDVKFVWNVINSASRKKWKESRMYFHKYNPYFTSIIKGASKELAIHSTTCQSILEQFHKDIHQHKKQLRYKGRRTLGWIPFKASAVKLDNNIFTYKKNKFKVWKSRHFPKDSVLKTGSFNQDSLGRWYVNFVIQYDDIEHKRGLGQVGIDLGMKTTATCSDGTELKLKTLNIIDTEIKKHQRARNFKRVKVLHAHKKNKRKDLICKFTNDLVKRNSHVVIGDVSGFTKGHLAKTRYDNSWSLLKSWIIFKCYEYGVEYSEVSEHLSTQKCNSCGSIEGPEGIKGLCVRNWICSCGVGHDRDINAAKNILNTALGN